MNEPSMDPQRLAALLDGRLPPAERADLLAHLAASEEDLALLADAATVVRELEQSEAATTSRRQPSASRWWYRPRWLLLAAGLAALALVPLVRSRRAALDETDPGRFAALLERPAMPPADRALRSPSSRGAADTLAFDVAAARLGMRLTDLEVAARTGDTSIASHARAVAALLDQLGAGPLATRYREVAEGATRPPGTVARSLGALATDAMRSTGRDQPLVELGAWLESARVALATRDTMFFHAPASRRLLDRSDALTSLSADARSALARVRESTRAEELPWAELDRSVTTTAAAVAGYPE